MFGAFIKKGVSQMHKQKLQLWPSLEHVFHIFQSAIPKRSDVGKSKSNVKHFYALYRSIFGTDSSQYHCFTPTTHEILPFPQMKQDCGPLVNISKVLPEKVIGEVGKTANTSRHVDIHILNKTLHKFCNLTALWWCTQAV